MNTYDEAYLKYDEGDFENAFNLFLSDAKSGGVDSMAMVALMYGDGKGVDYDFDKSVFWDKKAIKAGNVSSLLNLAITYRTTGDILNARHWFEKGLKAGDGEAAYELARMYMISDKEKETVTQLLSKALELNNLCKESKESIERLLKR